MRRRGQVLAEVAVSLPLLVVLLLAVLDFGWFLHSKIKMTHACREGVLTACRSLAAGSVAPDRLDEQVKTSVRLALGRGTLDPSAIVLERAKVEGRDTVSVETVQVYRPMLPFLWMNAGRMQDRVPIRVRMTAVVGRVAP